MSDDPHNPTRIFEGTPLTVTAKISSGIPDSVEEVTFKFCKNGEEFETKTGSVSDVHKVVAPAVADDQDSYRLEYHVFYKIKDKEDKHQILSAKKIDVVPRTAQLKVTRAKDGKPFPDFQFKVVQAGKQVGGIHSTFAYDTKNAKDETIPAGSAEFNLAEERGFSIVPVAPFEITEEVVGTGRKREVKGDVKVRAAFVTPEKGTIKQYVNYDVQNQGQTGIGHEVVVTLGVHPDDQRFVLDEESAEVHFRVTFGPADDAPVAKSARNDDKHPTKVMKVSDSDTSATIDEKEAGKKYEGKVTLTAGKGKIKVALGKAGGDTCTVEISGSDKFLTDTALSPDATLRFENWRRVYIESIMPDIMKGRADSVLAEASSRLKMIGRQTFVEFVEGVNRAFDAMKLADMGTLAPRRFLGSARGGDELVYILSGRNWRQLPVGVEWSEDSPGKTLRVIVCDSILKFRTDTKDEKAGATDFSGTVKEAEGWIDVSEKLGGLFLPFSGYDGADGISEVEWTADISKSDFPEHPGLDSESNPRTGKFSMRDVTVGPACTVKEWHFRLPVETPDEEPGPGSFVGPDKTKDKCPVKVAFSTHVHAFSEGEVDGNRLAWVCNSSAGPRQFLRLCLRGLEAAKDAAAIAHTHGNDGAAGDCLAKADALCADCIKHFRSRDLTVI